MLDICTNNNFKSAIKLFKKSPFCAEYFNVLQIGVYHNFVIFTDREDEFYNNNFITFTFFTDSQLRNDSIQLVSFHVKESSHRPKSDAKAISLVCYKG